MGVPKFFRYISERYPCLSELVRENNIPEYDNLYLDMNGIIHTCSHPDDGNIHFRLPEEQMFKDICHYIEALFRIIEPRKLFFMAVDGVAPRAKMNQQRGRRFRSAKDAAILEAKARDVGEILPEEARFDSNCITPGTEFMVRLQAVLKYFVKQKMSTDKKWQTCRIILSGHETPGEGEHKIMEYIRYLKASPNYEPNTRHCLYGLDADLIMLGLCTHESHFSLLREEVKFSKSAKRTTSVEETRFFLLHLGLLKEYLNLEFFQLTSTLTFPYDIEKIVDDWIFMGFMVGNDFIPHLPNLHISANALPLLYKAYIEILPTLDGYINEAGKLNLNRLEIFIKKLAEVDIELFKNHYPELQELNQDERNAETFNVNVNDIKNDYSMPDELNELVKNSEEMLFNNDDNEEDLPYSLEDDDEDYEDFSDTFDKEFHVHKRDYYITKLKYNDMTKEVLQEQSECYIRALQWTLSYYYRGVCSWEWFYPHHYAPYVSDLVNISNMDIKFELGKPFLPYQQLLAVLPSASKNLLPEAYSDLMTDPYSPIIDYYPVDFETDLNGKRQEWEAIVLIPFIDEKRLITAMDKCSNKLRKCEVERNIHGPMLQFDYCSINQGITVGPEGSMGVPQTFCTETLVWRDDVYVPESDLVLGPSRHGDSILYFPGFPTMKHIKHTGNLATARVRVFEQPSRNQSIILNITPQPEQTLKQLADELLGKEVFASWPHLTEVKIIAVADENQIIESDGKVVKNNKTAFSLHVRAITEHHVNRLCINLGDIKQLVHVTPIYGREYTYTTHSKFTLNKIWSPIIVNYPVQVIVKDLCVEDGCTQFKTIDDVYQIGSQVFLIHTSYYYGTMGEIVDTSLVQETGRLKLLANIKPEPNFENARKIHEYHRVPYFNSYNASITLGISSSVFARITGTILIVRGEKRFPITINDANKVNIGLQLKFPKLNEEIIGYTKKSGSVWLYSSEAVDIVKKYLTEYPVVLELLSKVSSNNSSDIYFESDLFSDVGKGDLFKMVKWIKELPHFKGNRRTGGSVSLEKNVLDAIVDACDILKIRQSYRQLILQVKPQVLFKPGLNYGSMPPDRSATYNLFDRVIIAKESYSVPLGYIGTIIAIHPVTDSNPIRQECLKKTDMYYEILFDEPFENGLSMDNNIKKRIYKVPDNALINISYGKRRTPEKGSSHVTNESATTKENSNQILSWRKSSQKPVDLKNNEINKNDKFSEFLQKSKLNDINVKSKTVPRPLMDIDVLSINENERNDIENRLKALNINKSRVILSAGKTVQNDKYNTSSTATITTTAPSTTAASSMGTTSTVNTVPTKQQLKNNNTADELWNMLKKKNCVNDINEKLHASSSSSFPVTTEQLPRKNEIPDASAALRSLLGINNRNIDNSTNVQPNNKIEHEKIDNARLLQNSSQSLYNILKVNTNTVNRTTEQFPMHAPKHQQKPELQQHHKQKQQYQQQNVLTSQKQNSDDLKNIKFDNTFLQKWLADIPPTAPPSSELDQHSDHTRQINKKLASQLKVQDLETTKQHSSGMANGFENNLYFYASKKPLQNFIYHPQPQHQPIAQNTVGESSLSDTTLNYVQPKKQNMGSQDMRSLRQLNKPQGPQTLSNSSLYSPGQGAFIPLQAMRGKLKSSVTEKDEKLNNHIKSDAIADNKYQTDAGTLGNQSTSAIRNEQQLITSKRPSRIAAKFDYVNK